jgi:hypothetical protein
MARKEKPPPFSWKDSVAKEKLVMDIDEGVVTEGDNWEDVHQSRPEYSDTDYNKFQGRLYRAFKSVAVGQDRASRDHAAMVRDRLIFPVAAHNHRGELRWEGSDAEAFLKQDVLAGKHQGMKPKAFRMTRAAYQLFFESSIRNHIYQEERLLNYYACREVASNKKKEDRSKMLPEVLTKTNKPAKTSKKTNTTQKKYI